MPATDLAIEVEALLDQINKRFDGMAKLLQEVPSSLSREMQDWQTADLHRRYPETEEEQIGDEFAAEMTMHPHSKPRPHHRTGNARGRPAGKTQGTRNPTVHRQGGQLASTQPLLRPEMFEKFCEREREIVHLITWDNAKSFT